MVHLIHRESWQSALSIYESRAEVTSFCLELSKKLDMRYESPSIRVDLLNASTGEIVHYQNERLNIDHKNTDMNIRSNVEIDHDNRDDISVPGSKSTVKSMNKDIESNVYHDLLIMYNNNNGSGGSTTHYDTTTIFTADTTANHATGSSVVDVLVDHPNGPESK